MTTPILYRNNPRALAQPTVFKSPIPDPWAEPMAADAEIPTPPQATGQYPDPVWVEAAAMQRALSQTESIPEPERATGQYPDPVWAEASQALGGSPPETIVPEPERATGQYPDPVWAEPAASIAASLQAEAIPEPPPATGQYPDPVWANPPAPAPLSVAPVELPRSPTFSAPPVEEPAPPPPTEPTVVNKTDSEATFLAFKEVDYSDDLEVALDLTDLAAEADGQTVLDFQEMYRMIRTVAQADSGKDLYAALSADREYQTPGQPAFATRRFGLAFGLVLFPQASGLLGKLLQIMQRRDEAAFTALFAPHDAALVAIANADTAEKRLQPVGGQLLWQEPWLTKFHQAGGLPAFQTAQNETAIEHQFRPLLRIAYELGFTSDRALAMVYDRVVTRGLKGGLQWIVQTVSPLQAPDAQTIALQTLGYESIAAFQADRPWAPQTQQFDLATQALVVGALRRAGHLNLTPDRLMSQLIAAASGSAQQRLLRLQASTELDDTIYRLDAAS